MSPTGIIPKDFNFTNAVGAVSSATDTKGSIRPLQYNPTSRGLTVHTVGDSSSPTGFNGAPVTVGTTAVELTFTGTTKSIAIKAASTNTGIIYIGKSNVTNLAANAVGELTADSALTIELNDAADAIYIVSDTAAQTGYKMALT